MNVYYLKFKFSKKLIFSHYIFNIYITLNMTDSIVYHNLNIKFDDFKEFCSDIVIDEKNLNVINNIKLYQDIINMKNSDTKLIDNYVFNVLENCVKNYVKNIFIPNADINYILDKITFIQKQKFSELLINLQIDTIINLMDFGQSMNVYRKNIKSKYLNIFYNIIINNTDNSINLLKNIDLHWKNINFKYLYDFLNSIRIGRKNNPNDMTEINNIVSNKFDDTDNVKKLLEFIKISFIENQHNFSEKDSPNKFNLYYIINILKSNGFLLFQEYEKDIINRYEISFYKNFEILDKIKNDINLVKFFIFIISKNNNNVNKYVNEMLIRTKNYLYDLFDSYNNNQAYYKIKVKCLSQKYFDFDIDSFNRNIASFKLFKYSTKIIDKEQEFSLNEINKSFDSTKLAPYYDIYRSYYKARYPDREIIINPFNSTLIVKINLNSKTYFIHLAVIQYIILDIILNAKEGISPQQIQEKTSIKLKKLNSTFKSLFKIKIIKKNTENNLYFINEQFTYGDGSKNKFSIASMVQIDSFKEQKEREFAHDKNTILQCNAIYFIKKNPYTTFDVIDSQLVYSVPFKYTSEQLQKVLDDSVKENYLSEQILDNNDRIYKLEEI